jgi:hypothetical protein
MWITSRLGESSDSARAAIEIFPMRGHCYWDAPWSLMERMRYELDAVLLVTSLPGLAATTVDCLFDDRTYWPWLIHLAKLVFDLCHPLMKSLKFSSDMLALSR